MEDKVYPIRSASIAYKVGFEGGVVYCHMLRRLKECRTDQVTKITLRKPPIGMGDELQFRIWFFGEGKEQKFPWIHAKIDDEATLQFFEDLKIRIPTNTIWEDLRNSVPMAEGGQKVYDLQFILMGYSGSGLPRTFQLWMHLILLGILILPLPYFIWLVSTGGYRIYITDQGLRLRKFRDSIYLWPELKVQVQKVNVRSQFVSTTKVMNIWFWAEGGRKKKVVMRFDQAKLLLTELVERRVLDNSILDDFI